MFQKFPSIEQFRTVIKYVNKYLPGVTTLKYKGTVKLHGTNAAIGVLKDGTVYFQSRNSIITPENDNAGFATFMKHFEIHYSIWKLAAKVAGLVLKPSKCFQMTPKQMLPRGLPDAPEMIPPCSLLNDCSSMVSPP